jgi:hypothetical protein
MLLLVGVALAGPIAGALALTLPFAGSDHTLDTDLGSIASLAPGLGARLELGWGAGPSRYALALAATDQLFDHGDCCDPEYIDTGLSLVWSPRLAAGTWALRLPTEAGLGLGFGSVVVPNLRVGTGLRVQPVAGGVRPLFELRLLGTFGLPVSAACIGCHTVGNPNGWQAALNVGVELGQAYDAAGG